MCSMVWLKNPSVQVYDATLNLFKSWVHTVIRRLRLLHQKEQILFFIFSFLLQHLNTVCRWHMKWAPVLIRKHILCELILWPGIQSWFVGLQRPCCVAAGRRWQVPHLLKPAWYLKHYSNNKPIRVTPSNTLIYSAPVDMRLASLWSLKKYLTNVTAYSGSWLIFLLHINDLGDVNLTNRIIIDDLFLLRCL